MFSKIFNFFLILAIVSAIVLSTGGSLLSIASAAPDAGRTTQNVIVNLGPQTLTVTASQTLTPTGSMYLLDNLSTLTLTLATGTALPGDILQIISEVVTNTVVQTNNTTLASAATISQNDVLKFVYANSQWVLEVNQNNAAD